MHRERGCNESVSQLLDPAVLGRSSLEMSSSLVMMYGPSIIIMGRLEADIGSRHIIRGRERPYRFAQKAGEHISERERVVAMRSKANRERINQSAELE